MSLVDDAAAFFSGLVNNEQARRTIAKYPIDLQLVTPGEAVIVRLRDGDVIAVEQGPEAVGYWTLELRGNRDAVDDLLSGAMTLGGLFYRGLLVAPEEKSKHNLVAAMGQAVRLLQEAQRSTRVSTS